MVSRIRAKKKTPLDYSFYQRSDVVQIAKELLGKWLFTQIDGDPMTGGIIVETEAYAGPEDRASHAFGNRRTKRTEVMYHEGGIAYIYLCYGVHFLLNVVTNTLDIPHAILIRAIVPKIGIETIKRRRNGKLPLSSGPGLVTQALGITSEQNGRSFSSTSLWIEDRGVVLMPEQILATPRIGIAYAKEHALLPWRFHICEKDAKRLECGDFSAAIVRAETDRIFENIPPARKRR